jgi:hypothetical protein
VKGTIPSIFLFLFITKEYQMTTITAKPASTAQINRINALVERGIISVTSMPSASWEASAIIRNSPASKRDKEELKAKGGRTIARMTSGEVEMTIKVVDALKLIDLAGSKNEQILEAATLLRKHFMSKAQ